MSESDVTIALLLTVVVLSAIWILNRPSKIQTVLSPKEHTIYNGKVYPPKTEVELSNGTTTLAYFDPTTLYVGAICYWSKPEDTSVSYETTCDIRFPLDIFDVNGFVKEAMQCESIDNILDTVNTAVATELSKLLDNGVLDNGTLSNQLYSTVEELVSTHLNKNSYNCKLHKHIVTVRKNSNGYETNSLYPVTLLREIAVKDAEYAQLCEKRSS